MQKEYVKCLYQRGSLWCPEGVETKESLKEELEAAKNSVGNYSARSVLVSSTSDSQRTAAVEVVVELIPATY